VLTAETIFSGRDDQTLVSQIAQVEAVDDEWWSTFSMG
jgi:hypothetical protein